MKQKLHLTFPEHLIQEPVLYQLGRELDVVPNITRANVEERFAWVIVEVEGAQASVDAAVAWLRERDIEVSIIGDAGVPS